MSPQEPRILIVDDEVDTCANLSDIFSDFGYRVDTAHDGLSALNLVERTLYDVALLDLRMPGMDGLELYRRIKEISAGTVAIVVTAYANSETARDVLAAGAWRIVSKPVNIQQLLGLVSQALDSPLVLVVDDDRELCDNLWEIFHDQGYRVHLAYDTSDAAKVLNQHEFHVILLDMKLPGGDGYDVLSLVRQTNQNARTVLITGHPAEMERRVSDAMQLGADAVCYKPFDVSQLLGTVEKLVPKEGGGPGS